MPTDTNSNIRQITDKARESKSQEQRDQDAEIWRRNQEREKKEAESRRERNKKVLGGIGVPPKGRA